MIIMNQKNGFSLVELMVSMVIGLVLTLGLFTMFRMSSTNVSTTSQFNELQENGRVALTLLERDLRMINFFWLAMDNVSVRNTLVVPPAVDCIDAVTNIASFPVSWPNFRILWGYDTSGASSLSCLAGNAVKNDTDVIQIKRLSFPQAPLVFTNTGQYFVGFDNDGRQVDFFQGAAGLAPVTPRNFQYLHHVYYIKEDDGVPNLKRRVLINQNMDAVGGSNQQLVQGIENIRYMYGVDTDNDMNVDQYLNAADVSADAWNGNGQSIVSVKISLLIRTVDEDPKHMDNVEYTLGDKVLGPFNDRYRRKVMSTTVVINNSLIF